VPAGRIFRAPEMLADPHMAAREAIVHVAHREFGSLAMQNVAPRLSDTPGRVRHAGPALGEHTDEVLGTLLGADAARIAALRARGWYERGPRYAGRELSRPPSMACWRPGAAGGDRGRFHPRVYAAGLTVVCRAGVRPQCWRHEACWRRRARAAFR